VARYLRLRRVDRDRHASEPFENGEDPAQFLVDRNALRTRSGRLAADVHDRGALVDHAARGGDRGLRPERHAAVRERVRRDVDDAHHGRPREPLLDRKHHGSFP
jgi:hypothetical protein